MDIYNLQDVVTPSELRSSVAAQIRKNAHVTNPKVGMIMTSCAKLIVQNFD